MQMTQYLYALGRALFKASSLTAATERLPLFFGLKNTTLSAVLMRVHLSNLSIVSGSLQRLSPSPTK